MPYSGEVIKIGSTQKDAIKAIKIRLNELKFGSFNLIDLSYSDGVEHAVKQFQEANQLKDDGIVGRLTWERLFNPRANKPVESRILRIRALEIMNTQLFVRELTGHNDGKEVEMYLKSVGLGKGFPWCQSLVFWSYELAATQLKIANPMPRTGGVLDHLARVKKSGIADIIYDNPEEGDLFIMDFGGGKGHTGGVEARVEKMDFTIEGNTNDEGSREGNGVFERSRVPHLMKCYIRYKQTA